MNILIWVLVSYKDCNTGTNVYLALLKKCSHQQMLAVGRCIDQWLPDDLTEMLDQEIKTAAFLP